MKPDTPQPSTPMGDTEAPAGAGGVPTFGAMAWRREPVVIELPVLLPDELPDDGAEPWRILAYLVEAMVAANTAGGMLIHRAFQVLRRIQGEGRTIPVGEDRFSRLAEHIEDLRGQSGCVTVSACRILEAFPELAEVLPDPELQLELEAGAWPSGKAPARGKGR